MKKILLSVIALLAVSASSWAAESNSNKQAALPHDMMQSNTSDSSQGMAEMHKEMIKTRPCGTNEAATSFSAMNEHEKAAIAHETANNGQSSVSHQQQAQQHRRQMTEN